MLRTLYAKLSLSLIVLLTIVGVFYTLLNLSTARYFFQETSQKLNLDLAQNLVADQKLVQDGRIDEKALSTTFMKYMVINPSIEIYLLDINGNILSYSAEPGKVKRNSVSLQPIKAFINGEKLPLLGDDPRSHERQKIFSVTPLPPGTKNEGYLYVVLQGTQYDTAEKLIKANVLWKQTALALIVSLSIGLVIGLLLFRKLTKRLNNLSTKMAQFHDNDFSAIPENGKTRKSNDEIDQLDQTFNQMAQRIVNQLNELKQQNNLRRELVANVSHDLRTPVAILHGYLETLDLKAEQLSATDQRDYIKQALLSSEHLSRLINKLFDLASLEARDSLSNVEQFNLSELAHDLVLKFKLKAKEKQINLNMIKTKDILFANGDIALIERLFENLLGNALKFTPNNGYVDLSLEKKGDTAIVHVRDGGPGIPDNEIDKIFERFYQGKKNSNRVKLGGLGLAIAKRIANLHGGNISVKSNPEQGTVFTLSLPQIAE